jgi:hypothetical protein
VPGRPFSRSVQRISWLTVLCWLMSGLLVPLVAQALPDVAVGYSFGEGSGTAISDTSTTNTDATATNPTWTSSGRFDNAITFNGTSTRVRSTTSITLDDTFTLEAWVFNPSNESFETIMTIGAERDLYLNFGTLNLYTGDTNLSFGPALAVNTWQHVALVSDGTTIRAYVDGTQRGTTQNTDLTSTQAPIQIGSWISGSSNEDYYSGTLDEIRLYNRALTPAEIATDRTTPIGS